MNDIKTINISDLELLAQKLPKEFKLTIDKNFFVKTTVHSFKLFSMAFEKLIEMGYAIIKEDDSKTETTIYSCSLNRNDKVISNGNKESNNNNLDEDNENETIQKRRNSEI